jgi:hypothetical protein
LQPSERSASDLNAHAERSHRIVMALARAPALEKLALVERLVFLCGVYYVLPWMIPRYVCPCVVSLSELPLAYSHSPKSSFPRPLA